MENNCISLSKFLSRYYNLTGEKLKYISHDDVRILFPNVRSTSMQYLKKKANSMNCDINDLIFNGSIILVYDGHKTLPYYVPELSFEDDEYQVDFQKSSGIKVNDKEYDYTKLSEYELRQLLIRKTNSSRNQLNARKELERRGIPITKKYKRSEFKKGF